MQKIIMLLDMNSYFASVEQQANPFLRGRPVGVCAYLSAHGCIIAPSIEAKKYGVKTGMRVSEAKSLCPEIVLLENEPAKYRFVSRKVFSILADYSDSVFPYSIDEAFVDLSGWVKDFAEAVFLAKLIKKRIKAEVGAWLKCSIGISFTNWLAKFAAEEKKPDSLTVISRRDLSNIFINRPLQQACGIGKKTEQKLKLIGINTLDQLQKANPQNLIMTLGKQGYYLWAHLNGIEVSGWIKKENNQPKSIGHSYCMPKQGKDKEYLRSILFKLCEKTGRRLRQQGLKAYSVCVSWNYVKAKGESHSRRLAYPVFTTQDIYHQSVSFLNLAFLSDDVSLIAVSVGHLVPYAPQLSFWSDDNRYYALSKALDDINSRYGEYTVYQGLLHKVKEQAKDRIGFRKSVGVRRAE